MQLPPIPGAALTLTAVEALLAVTLAAITLLLHRYYREHRFLPWWGAAWLVHVASLLFSQLVILGPRTGLLHDAALAMTNAASVLHALLVVIGALQYRWPTRRMPRWTVSASIAASLLMGLGMLWWSWGSDPLRMALLRGATRSTVAGVAYLAAGALITIEARRRRAPSGLFMGALFAAWAATRVMSGWMALLPGVAIETASAATLWWRLATAVGQAGLLVGIVLLALEEQRTAARALALAQERLSRSEHLESMGRMAGAVAHDFNNFLLVFRLSTDLVDDRVGDTDPQVREEISQLRAALDRAGALVQQILAFASRQPGAARDVNVRKVVADLQPLLRRMLGRATQLVVHADGRPLVAHIDPAQLEQVVVNLAVNGRDAMPDGGPLHITVEPSAEEDGWILITVADAGVGMTSDLAARIFEPFFTTKGDHGTGLGLATVRSVVTSAGGRVEVETVPGSGSRFHVLLPPA